MKEITEKQFYALIGLLLAKNDYDRKLKILHEVWFKIVGKEGSERFWDYYLEQIDEEVVKENLKFDGVKIKK